MKYFSLKSSIVILLGLSAIAYGQTKYENDTVIADYISIDRTESLFFLLVESKSKPEKDPLIIWLQGGPGCSSMIGMFKENGPYSMDFDRMKDPSVVLKENPHSWNKKANVLYLDQPLGTGFSFASRPLSYRMSEYEISTDFYHFLVGFMEKYPQFKKRPLYLAGESYAGHYIPMFAKFISEKSHPEINLSGLAIGNGWVDPFYQFPTMNSYAYENGLINGPRSFISKIGFDLCSFSMLLEIPIVSLLFCQAAQIPIYGNPIYPDFNVYDIREECDKALTCFPEDGLSFHIGGRKFKQQIKTKPGGNWQECNSKVKLALTLNFQKNYGHYLKNLLNQGLPVLVYNGDKDYQNNWKGAEAWTQALVWDLQDEFNNQTFQDWSADPIKANVSGQVKSYKNFSFFRIYDAGLMVPRDQPEVAQTMIYEFIQNGHLLTGDKKQKPADDKKDPEEIKKQE